jgi:N-acetylneuraminic acid mutarotase
VSGSLYVIGGNGSTLRLNTVEKYIPSTNTWTEEAPLLVGKSEPAAGLLDKKIISPDGFTTSQDTGDNEAYDVSTNAWSALPADPTPRNATCFGAVSSLLYVAGGGGNGTPESVTESFKATTNKWATLLAMPQPVIFPASAVADGLLYRFGGTNVDHGSGTIYNNLQIYQP